MLSLNKILIACPVRNREWILPIYLEHLYKIDYPKKLISLYFIVNNSTDGSSELLKQFKLFYGMEYADITIDTMYKPQLPDDARIVDIRNQHIYHWLSELRNYLLMKCVQLKCDYLLSCDTDILVPSNILNELIIDDKSVCASLIYNGYHFKPQNAGKGYNAIRMAYQYPNILNLVNEVNYKHVVNYHVKNPNLCNKDKLLEIDATGAVSIIPFSVCRDTRYSWDKQGEDIAWSRDCQAKGYKLYCKPSVYSQHIMSEGLLEDYLNGKLQYNNGEIIKIV